MSRTNKSNLVQAMEDGTYFVESEIPTGPVNGSNKTFTLAGTSNPATSLEVFINGQKIVLTTDYTLTGDSLVMELAYPTGTAIRVNYRVSPD